jgi:hypothetical protein
MEKKHYCIVTNTYFDGSSTSKLVQVDDVKEPYRIPLTPHNQEESQSGRYFHDIEAVKDDLLHDFLIEQFDEWNLRLGRFEDKSGNVRFNIEDEAGNLLYSTTTWDGVMDAYTQYVKEDHFLLNRKEDRNEDKVTGMER